VLSEIDMPLLRGLIRGMHMVRMAALRNRTLWHSTIVNSEYGKATHWYLCDMLSCPLLPSTQPLYYRLSLSYPSTIVQGIYPLLAFRHLLSFSL
jgi:hypothetical protein